MLQWWRFGSIASLLVAEAAAAAAAKAAAVAVVVICLFYFILLFYCTSFYFVDIFVVCLSCFLVSTNAANMNAEK